MELPDQITARLIKLLTMAKADSGASDQEVETALAAAQRLAIKYQVDLATFSLDQGKLEDPFVVEQFETAKGIYRRPPCDRMIVSILLSYFDVDIVYSGDVPSRISIIGRKSKVEFAKYLYCYLRDQFNRIWRSYKEEYYAPMSARASVFSGIHLGLANRLFREKSEAEQEAIQENAAENGIDINTLRENYGIMIQSEKDQRRNKMDEEFGELIKVKTKVREIEDWDGYNHGREKGSELQIHRPLTNTEVEKIN